MSKQKTKKKSKNPSTSYDAIIHPSNIPGILPPSCDERPIRNVIQNCTFHKEGGQQFKAFETLAQAALRNADAILAIATKFEDGPMLVVRSSNIADSSDTFCG